MKLIAQVFFSSLKKRFWPCMYPSNLSPAKKVLIDAILLKINKFAKNFRTRKDIETARRFFYIIFGILLPGTLLVLILLELYEIACWIATIWIGFFAFFQFGIFCKSGVRAKLLEKVFFIYRESILSDGEILNIYFEIDGSFLNIYDITQYPGNNHQQFFLNGGANLAQNPSESLAFVEEDFKEEDGSIESD